MKIDSVSNLSYVQNVMSNGRTPNARPVLQDQNLKTQAPTSESGLTGAERAFFAKLFPGSSVQITSHKTYSPAGFKTSVELGQIVNRKG